MKWFGKPWNPRACTPSEKVGTPVGEKCRRCTSHIEEEDQGVILFCAVSIDTEKELCEVQAEACHLDCFLRMLLPPDYIKKHQGVISRNPGKN